MIEPVGFFSKLLRYVGVKTKHEEDGRTDSITYLGMFGMTVDQARARDMTLVATNIDGFDDRFTEVLDWCRDRGCKVFWDRVTWDKWKGCWESNGIGGVDVLFIASDVPEVITEARLSWGGYHNG